ncbi:hypothetical protein [Kitasatospora sp. NPDC086791]|uniref:hypothetical protein n=1 Tax=Kitasatospora sp. NPDC086791 TaxID=3155178 RepID=UPI003446E489
MPSSGEYADLLWFHLDTSQIPARVVHTGSGEYSVEIPVCLGGVSMHLEVSTDEFGTLWQLRDKHGPGVGGSRSDLTVDRVPDWVRTLLSHFGGHLDEPFFRPGDKVLVADGDGEAKEVVAVAEVVETGGMTFLVSDADGRRWPAATAVHAMPVAERRALSS